MPNKQKRTPRPLPKKWRWLIIEDDDTDDGVWLSDRRAPARKALEECRRRQLPALLVDIHHPNGPTIVEEVKP